MGKESTQPVRSEQDILDLEEKILKLWKSKLDADKMLGMELYKASGLPLDGRLKHYLWTASNISHISSMYMHKDDSAVIPSVGDTKSRADLWKLKWK